MIAAGKHYGIAKRETADVGRTPNTGTQFVLVTFDLLNPDDKLSGESVSWQGWLTDKTSERTIQSLLYCGWDGEDWDTFEGIDRNKVELVVEHEEYEKDGQMRTAAKVAWVNQIGAGRVIQEEHRITGDNRKALAKALRAQTVSLRSKLKAESAAKGQQASDDVPF